MWLILLRAAPLHNNYMMISSLQFQITTILQIYSLKHRSGSKLKTARVNIYRERVPFTIVLHTNTPTPRDMLR